MKFITAPLALIVLAAPVWAENPARPAKSQRFHGPIIIHERHASQVTSSNWSGYAVTGAKGSVTDVTASWVVPSIAGSCPAKDQFASFWVGIDGYSSNSVEQIGTDSDCQDGEPVYYAWFEFYPHPSFTVNSVPIKPGNVIFAEVKAEGKGKFTVTLENKTTGTSFSTTAKVASAAQSSAEWIAEAPYSGGVLPLADFTTVSFGEDHTGQNNTCYATIGGAAAQVGSASFSKNLDAITMDTSSGVVKASPLAISKDGTSFSIAWMNAGP